MAASAPVSLRALLRRGLPAHGWRLAPSAHWLEAGPTDAALPVQGWKLHLSAHAREAEAVLARALPILVNEAATFKITASPAQLQRLNQGLGGESQVGKFLTIYPRDDAHAVRLAALLDEATRGLSGPSVPSDRPLRPGSLVHYRFGAFAARYRQNALGLIEPVVATPAGDLAPDERGLSYQAPEWQADPFAAAGLVVRPTPRLLLGERFLFVRLLHRSTGSDVRAAIDLQAGGARRVLKRAGRDGSERTHDAHARLRREFDLLRLVTDDGRYPAAHELYADGDDLYLVMEDCDALGLDARVAQESIVGHFLPAELAVRWASELAGALASLHAAGLIHGDVKSGNILIGADDRLRLLDLDAAKPLGAAGALIEGTPGYLAPERRPGHRPAVTDDIYAVGAVLALLLTGSEPSRAPRSGDLLQRPLALLNPAAPPALIAIAERCLARRPADRYQSMADLIAALCAAPLTPPSEAPRRRTPRWLDQARRLGDALAATLVEQTGRPGRSWRSRHDLGDGLLARDLNDGAAGGLLVLADLVAAFNDAGHRRALRDAADWLAAAPPLPGGPLPGLFVGELGIAYALLVAGRMLGDEALVARAHELGEQVARMPHASPDLFNGTAGRLRGHLLLWRDQLDSAHLAHAIACGERLLACATRPDGTPADFSDPSLEVVWPIPEGYGGASGQRYLGYAHGAAGIADALLDLHRATGDDRWLPPARAVARLLARTAVPVLADNNGRDWPDVEGGALTGAMWCHGATGIGGFLLSATDYDLLPDGWELARAAGRAAGGVARWANPVLCHGLAGKLNLLLHLHNVTGERHWRQEAEALGRLLLAWRLRQGGRSLITCEDPGVAFPELLTGYAGAAYALLRLGGGETAAVSALGV